MPNAVFDPGGCWFVEPEFDLDRVAAHDPDGIFDVVFQIKIQGYLKWIIGGRNSFHAFHREHAYVFAEVAIADEIEGALAIPEAIRTDFSSGRLISGRGKIAHLHSALLAGGFH